MFPVSDHELQDSYVYIGGEDVTKEGTFRWINGETVQQEPWYYSQPNNDGNAEHCLTKHRLNNYSFFDRECSKEYSFLCEISV